MNCINCNHSLEQDAKFCVTCGKKVEVSPGAVDEYFSRKENTCQICGRNVPEVKYIEFYQNIGYIIARSHRSIKGKLCKHCIHEYFWKYTGITFFFGWWGVVSFVMTCLFLCNNIGRYIMALPMKSE